MDDRLREQKKIDEKHLKTAPVVTYKIAKRQQSAVSAETSKGNAELAKVQSNRTELNKSD